MVRVVGIFHIRVPEKRTVGYGVLQGVETVGTIRVPVEPGIFAEELVERVGQVTIFGYKLTIVVKEAKHFLRRLDCFNSIISDSGLLSTYLDTYVGNLRFQHVNIGRLQVEIS